jgi:peptide/nickel transport system substrate-binding protein
MKPMHRMNPLSLFGKCRPHRFASVVTVVCLLLTVLATLVVTAPSVGAVQDYHEYRIGVREAPDTFNPFDMMAGTSWSIAHMMYEFLYAVGPMMEPYPQLAASHEVTNENRTWTYHLVEDSYWHDGLPVTAHDVKFTFDMIMDNPQECALLGDYLTGFDEVLALDSHTVQINLLTPKANMQSLIVPILPEHLWTAVRDSSEVDIDRVDMFDTDYFPLGPIGSGPFILEDYKMAEGEVHLSAHKPYHRLPGIEVDSVNIDKLLFVIYKSDNAMTTALEVGDIDVVGGVPPSVWETLMANEDIDVQTPATLILEEFGFNCAPKEWRLSVDEFGERNFPDASTNYETCNLTVRQACAMATDIEYIADEIHQGMAQPAYGLIPPATPFWHYNVPPEERWDYGSHEDCVEAANQMLEDVGYRYISSTTIRENESNGALLEFEFYYIRSNIHDQQTAEMMQIWWADIGVWVNLHDVSEGNLYDLMSNMEYDMFIWSWWPDVDPTWFLSVLTTGEIPVDNSDTSAWSDCFYTNPEYDLLYLEQQEMMDLYERQAIVHEMQRIVYRDCPYINLVYPAGLIAYRTDKYENFPDMEIKTGISPSSFWYYFEITPIGGSENTAPYDVDIVGGDRTVYVGTEARFSGSARDLESAEEDLTWTWTIMELLDTTTLYGKTITHEFSYIADCTVILEVEDPEGLSDLDSIVVTVVEMPEDVGWIVGYVNDTAGDPIAGALVVAQDTSNQQSSDESGFFNLTLGSGTYEIYATAEGYSNESASVTVTMGNAQWQNFTLSLTSGSVAGDVLDSVDMTVAITGALVELYRPGDEEAAYAKKTDDSGSFVITVVDEGTYEVIVSKTGYVANDTETVTVVPNETASLTIYLTAAEEDDDGEGGGLGAIAIAVGVLAIIAAVAAAALLLKRRRRGPGPETMEDEPPEEPPPDA